MILALLLLAATPAPETDAARYTACAKLVASDPKQAEAVATLWGRSGAIPARQCLGLAFSAQDRWAEAAAAFGGAARDAETQRDGRAATLWVQAGNAAVAASDPEARVLLDRALALPVLPPQMRGEVLLDRARADVTANEPGIARTDIDAALALVPKDPMAWLLSATLARRMNDAPRATKDATEAVRLAPDDAATHYEQGNAAWLSGDPAAAKAAWSRAIVAGPDKPAGRAAKAALADASAP